MPQALWQYSLSQSPVTFMAPQSKKLWRALFAKLATQQQHSSKQDARAKRSDFRTEQQAFIALRILYGYSYGLNFVAQSPPSQSPAQSRSSSRKIRVLSDRMNADKLSLRIQILSEEAFLISCTCVFTKKRSLGFLDSIDSGGLWEKVQMHRWQMTVNIIL